MFYLFYFLIPCVGRRGICGDGWLVPVIFLTTMKSKISPYCNCFVFIMKKTILQKAKLMIMNIG